MLSFGDPRPFAKPIHDAGAHLICQVQTVAQAREAAEAGADIIVAQGTEAGGHGMAEPLFTLLPQVLDACPGAVVVAAGGIADGRGLAAALMFGAQGVLVGTRFYATEEAEGHPDAKKRIVDAQAGQTVRSIVFDLSRQIRWPTPYTGRLLRNRHAETWLGRERELEARMEEVGREYAAARERGDFDMAESHCRRSRGTDPRHSAGRRGGRAHGRRSRTRHPRRGRVPRLAHRPGGR